MRRLEAKNIKASLIVGPSLVQTEVVWLCPPKLTFRYSRDGHASKKAASFASETEVACNRKHLRSGSLGYSGPIEGQLMSGVW